MANDCNERRVIRLELLDRAAYDLVAFWEYGDIDDLDREAFAARLEQPNCRNYAVMLNDWMRACIQLEQFGSSVRFHVSKDSHYIKPQEMAIILIEFADYLFQAGAEELEAVFPPTNRAARRLAIRSWMTHKDTLSDGNVRYAITKDQYYCNIENAKSWMTA